MAQQVTRLAVPPKDLNSVLAPTQSSLQMRATPVPGSDTFWPLNALTHDRHPHQHS